MKNLILYSFLLLIASGSIQAQCDQKCRSRVRPVNLQARYPSCPNQDQYVTVISDEFDRGSLDAHFWRSLVPHASNWQETQEYNTLDNLQFLSANNGTLRMRSTYDPIFAPGDPSMGDHELFDDEMENLRWWYFKSGAITSRWNFEKGRYLIRAKIPAGWEMWPAFWLTGICADEIDIFEFMQDQNNHIHDRKISLSVHTKLTNCNDPDHPQDIDTKGYNLGVDMTTSFHNYSVDWDDFQIIFAVDGQVRRTFFHYYRKRTIGQIVTYQGVPSCDAILPGANYVEDPQFSDAAMNIVINSAVRNGATTGVFPKNFDIDFFKFLETIDCDATITLNSNQNIEDAGRSIEYGDRAITAGNIIISPTSNMAVNGPPPQLSYLTGDYLVLTAANEIQVLPGFDVLWDGNLVCQVKPCSQNKQLDDMEALFSLPEPETIFLLNDSVVSEETAMQILAQQPTTPSFSLYPNPTSRNVFLAGTEMGDEILVTNGFGQTLIAKNSLGHEAESLATESLVAGIYLVQIKRDFQIVYNLKLVIQK